MSISHREFFRLLPRAVGNRVFSTTDRDATIEIGNGQLDIHLSEEGQFKIASLQLPRTVVSFEFTNVEESERIQFLSQFDMAFQRGGG